MRCPGAILIPHNKVEDSASETGELHGWDQREGARCWQI